MAEHPLNLALRFVLELAALAALAVWGWSAGEGALRPALAVGLPLAAALIWAAFRAADDGPPPRVEVPGAVRLLLELALFAGAVAALAGAGRLPLAALLGGAVAVHYALSRDRVRRLLRG